MSSDLDLFEEEAAGQPSDTKSSSVSDKYAGKGVEDLIKMHQNAEKLISRQGADLAAQRRLSDQLLDLKKVESPKPVERQPVTVEALLNDPERALKSAVESSEVFKRAEAAEQRVARLEARITEKDFVTRYPSFKDDMEDPEFKAWVSRNDLKQALANEAAKGDYKAADSLWSLWEETKELKGSTKKDTKPNDKTGSIPKTVRSTPAENHSGRKFSRAKLMELRARVANGDDAAVARWNDPEFQRSMIQAYQEGRVV